MNTRGAHTEDDAAIPAALRKPVLGALWKEAGAFVAFLLELFSPDHLRDTGINRERGAQLSIYLANIEAGIRRLILAAALVFTPPAPQPRAARTQPPRAKPVARKHRAGLCIIRLPSTESTPAIPSQLAAMRRPPAPKPYGHMPFPCDPLPQPPAAAKAQHRPHLRDPAAQSARPLGAPLAPRSGLASARTFLSFATPEDSKAMTKQSGAASAANPKPVQACPTVSGIGAAAMPRGMIPSPRRILPRALKRSPAPSPIRRR